MEVLLSILDLACIYYVIYIMATTFTYALAGRTTPYRKTLLPQIPPALILSALYLAIVSLYQAIPDPPDFNYFRAIFGTIELVALMLWIFYLLRDMDLTRRFFFFATVFPFNFICSSIILMTLEAIAPGNFTPPYIFLRFFTIFAIVGVVVITVRLTCKTKFWHRLQTLADYPKLYIPMGTIYVILYILTNAFGLSILPDYMLFLIISPVYLALLMIAAFLVSDIKRTESLNAAQNLLLQQQSYINKLESIQQNLRSIQHDYKNMLTGLYAQASDGNTEAVKEYIGEKLLKVDEAVRKDLSQMNQLVKIEIPELKGLILSKMLDAERSGVSFRLEAMFPVSKTSMAAEDLLRCVGILLDNAIEEAGTQSDADVTLLLLQEEKTLTVVVKNPVLEKPDLRQIRQDGYSTKGPGRGIGLSNYRNILRKYPNAAQETKIEGVHFVQALVLAEHP